MRGAFWYDFSSLPGHQVQQLIDEKGRRKSRDSSARDCDQLSTDGTPVKKQQGC